MRVCGGGWGVGEGNCRHVCVCTFANMSLLHFNMRVYVCACARCNVLQRVAACCSVLHCAAVWCNISCVCVCACVCF